MDSLPTIETARRLLRSHGIDDARLEATAKEQRRAWERAWEEENPTDSLTPAGQADLWLLGSVKQLQRHWGGRCISCAQWTQPTSPERDDHGVCRAILADSTDGLVRLANSDRKLIATVAQFGCICWQEIPADDAETLHARAELAMELGLLPKMPEGA